MVVNHHSRLSSSYPLRRHDVLQRLEEAGSPERLILVNENMDNIDLSGLDLRGAKFHETSMVNANLSDAILYDARFVDTNLESANLQGAQLSSAYFNNVRFQLANLFETRLRSAHLVRCDFSGATLAHAVFDNAILTRTVMTRVYGVQASMDGAAIDDGDLSNSNFALSSFLSAAIRMTNASRTDFRGSNFDESEIIESRFVSSDLSMATFVDATLREVDLSRARIFGGEFTNVFLVVADFQGVLMTPAAYETLQPDLAGALNWEFVQIVEYVTATLRINEEPLTLGNLARIVKALQEYYTACWLLLDDRLEELIDYLLGRSPWLEDEVPLEVGGMSHNSPAEISLSLDAKLGKEIQETVDAFVQVSQRKEERQLLNRQLEHSVEHGEAQANEDLYQSQTAFDIKRREAELKLELGEIELERQRLALAEERQKSFSRRLELAMEQASRTVAILRPDIPESERRMMERLLVSKILQFGEGSEWQLVLEIDTATSALET